MRDIIDEFVRMYRDMYNLRPTNGYKPKMSCFDHDKGTNLLYRQLVFTTNGEAGWEELNDPEIEQLVLDTINRTGYGKNLFNLENTLSQLQLKDRVIAFDFDELLVPEHLAKKATDTVGTVDQDKLRLLNSNSYEGITYLASLYFGLPEEDYNMIISDIITPLRSGFMEVLSDLDKESSVIVISSGLADISRRALPQYQAIGCEFEKNGKITGSRIIISDILKGYITRKLSREHHVISVGHSIGDIPMLENSHVGIAYGHDIEADYHIHKPQELISLIK